MKNFAGKFWSFSFYFLFFAGAVAVYNYLALYFDEQGLPGSQIGVLMGVSSLIGIFTGPLWSLLADASHRHRLVETIAILGNVTALFLVTFVHGFLAFLILMIVQSIFGGPIVSMVDNATMSMLGDEKEKYGNIRLGGSIGWGVAAPMIGMVVQRYGLHWNFSIYAVLLLIALISVQQLHFGKLSKANESFSRGVRELLNNRQWIIFLTIVFIAGCGTAIISDYLFVYLQNIGTSPTLMGWAVTISIIAEVPAMYVAGRVIKRVGSHGLFTIGMAAIAIRCMLYSVNTVPWIALTIQLLQFFGFPMLWVAGVSYADENAPAGMGATVQSIFNSAFMGFGFAAGGFFGGVLIEYAGVRQMFMIFGAVILVTALLYGLLKRKQTVPLPVTTD